MKIMISLLLLAAPVLSFSQDDAVSALQKKCQGSPDCFSLTLTGNLLGAFTGQQDKVNGHPEKAFQSLKILFVKDLPGNYSARDLRRLKAEIARQSLDEVMSVKSANGNIKVLMKDGRGQLNEFFVLIDKVGDGFAALELKGALPHSH